MRDLNFPGHMDAAAFLTQHWQKRPLLMRGAFRPAAFQLDADELAGLALEPDVEGRLVIGGDNSQLRLEESPFDADDLTSLPCENWTLLVQDVEKHLPDIAGFLEPFSFLPSWRFDDLMISVATAGGGVGPHVDQYDVFLCQVAGQRRWQIGAPGEHLERSNSPLRQIESFTPTETMILGPGDILYLPPGIPHNGIARDFCSTWSVGFRAPTQAELVAAIAPDQLASASQSLRYTDADLKSTAASHALIDKDALSRFRKLLGGLVDSDDATLLRQLGEFLTVPKPWLVPESPENLIDAAGLRVRLAAGETLYRHGMALFARASLENRCWLFTSGTARSLTQAQWPLATLLCSARSFTAAALVEHADKQIDFDLLVALYNDGQLMLADDYDEI